VVLLFPQMDGGAGMHVIITGNMPGKRRRHKLIEKIAEVRKIHLQELWKKKRN